MPPSTLTRSIQFRGVHIRDIALGDVSIENFAKIIDFGKQIFVKHPRKLYHTVHIKYCINTNRFGEKEIKNNINIK